ncbi:LuxR C-terminal-related transcriptional regulator [Streptomyces sp. NPDC058612]|uniref:LuxR C-terminal-related transcriptional regulator n=1 Tax=Streptomyces sp. NPDC058612 TaxID=3346555 RepID=UPI00364E80AA
MINISVIDDDKMFRHSIVSWLEAETEIRATAFPSLPAFLAAGSAPGIVTLDLHLGDKSMPVENVRALTAAGHKVVVMTVVPPKEWIGDVTAAGATAYLLKPEHGLDTLVQVVRQIAAGYVPTTADHAFWLAQDDSPPPLYPREEQILQLVGDGVSHKDIAAGFGCAVSTVRTHLANVRQKYQASQRPYKRLTDYRDWAQERNLDRDRLDPGMGGPA